MQGFVQVEGQGAVVQNISRQWYSAVFWSVVHVPYFCLKRGSLIRVVPVEVVSCVRLWIPVV